MLAYNWWRLYYIAINHISVDESFIISERFNSFYYKYVKVVKQGNYSGKIVNMQIFSYENQVM